MRLLLRDGCKRSSGGYGQTLYCGLMKLASFDAFTIALQNAGVRYLIAGGMAVNAHGYLRSTQDVDIVIQLGADNIARAFSALALLGYRPAVPVTAEQFADESQRQRWASEKAMTVLSFWSDMPKQNGANQFSLMFPFLTIAAIRVTSSRMYASSCEGVIALGPKLNAI